jgi:hypothetical protein
MGALLDDCVQSDVDFCATHDYSERNFASLMALSEHNQQRVRQLKDSIRQERKDAAKITADAEAARQDSTSRAAFSQAEVERNNHEARLMGAPQEDRVQAEMDSRATRTHSETNAANLRAIHEHSRELPNRLGGSTACTSKTMSAGADIYVGPLIHVGFSVDVGYFEHRFSDIVSGCRLKRHYVGT